MNDVKIPVWLFRRTALFVFFLSLFFSASGQISAQSRLMSSEMQMEEAANWNSRGVQMAQSGDLVGAIKTWRQGIDYFPAYLHFYNNIGGGLRRLGYLQEAMKWYEACLKIQPTYWTWYNLGLLHEDLKDFSRAIEAHRQALALHPEFQLAFEHLMKLEREGELRRFARSKPVNPAEMPRLAPVSPPFPVREVLETVREPVPIQTGLTAKADQGAAQEIVSPEKKPIQPRKKNKGNKFKIGVEPVEVTAQAIVRLPERLPGPISLSDEPGSEPVVRRLHDSGGVVFVTFDGGADADGIPAILAALRQRGAKSTFFLTGRWVKMYPELARQIRAEGHEMGNHSMTHPNMSQYGRDRLASELRQTEEVFEKVLGEKPIPYFRFPFGAQNRRVENIVAELGYQSVYWDIDTLDWKEPSAASIVAKVRQRLKPGAVILMHCGSRSGSKALPRVLEEIIGRGYRPGMLSQVDPSQVAILSRK